MSIRTYYHAGLSRIEKFYLPYGGLHMGGKGSALEAALRKLRKEPEGFVFLHEVLVDDEYVLPNDDLGDAHSWERSWDLMSSRLNFPLSGWEYKNLFEPDIRNSICLFRLEVIKSVKVSDIFTLDQAEDELVTYEDRNGWPQYVA